MSQQCPDCRNEFVQPFKCTTCGAQKLHDATVRGQARDIETLRGLLAELRAVVLGECPRLLDEDRDGNGELAVRISGVLDERPL